MSRARNKNVEKRLPIRRIVEMIRPLHLTQMDDPEAIFHDLEQVACGDADDETRERVQATLENSMSPLSMYLEWLRNERETPLTMALEAGKRDGEALPPTFHEELL